jgi:predicted lipoprotein
LANLAVDWIFADVLVQKFIEIKMKKIGLLVCAFLITISLADCKKKKSTEEEEELAASFDKSGMLTNYSDAIIISNFQSAKISLDSLNTAYSAFTQTLTEQNLLEVRQKFITAYVNFQYVALFEFGPSENEIVRANFNTYPTDSVQIKSNITAGVYDLSTVPNLDAKGFPAIDYLLYGKNISDAQVVALFAGSANRATYVANCLSEMQSKLNNIITNWNGSYRATFQNSKGSEIGSSLGLLVNQLSYEIDLLKNGKLGIPLGKKSLGVIYPEKCEAYYTNTISVRLAQACLLNIENVYLGRSKNGNDGLGIDDYLDALKAQHNSGTLNDAIKNQFNVAKAKLALVSEPLSQAIINNPAAADAAYVETVKLLVLLKTDMPSALGIVITYQDGDGD